MFKQMLAVSVYGENSGLMECLPAGHLAMKFKKLIHVLLLIDLCYANLCGFLLCWFSIVAKLFFCS